MSLISLSTRRNALLGAGLAIAALATCLSSCATKPAPDLAAIPVEDETAEALPLVNQLRAAHGLAPLKIDPAATAAAEHQAKRMVGAKKMAHLIGFGDDFGRRVLASGVRLPAAENIAEGQRTVPAVVNAWKNSPHHMENMMGHYTGIGVAVARDSTFRDHPYWSMVLSSN